MKLIRARVKENLDLKVAIGVAIALSLYSLQALSIDTLASPTTRFLPPIAILYAMVFWVIGVLWLAYRRWNEVIIKDKELEEIITGINPDAFVVVSPDRQVLMCSPGVERMLGYVPQELLGKTTEELYFDRRSADGKNHGIRDQLERLGFHLGYATGKHKNGSIVPLEIFTGSIRGRRGAVLLLRDITKRVEAEKASREKAKLAEQLQSNITKLHETEEARDNILHMIVHDMKNPLQVILGTMQLLKEEIGGDSTATIDSYVDETLSHTRRLIDMVISLLDVSRLECGQMPLHLGSSDLRVAAKRALASLTRIAMGRTMRVYVPADPVPVSCDSEIIHRVLTNLISNAIHHTPQDAQVTITVKPCETTARVEVSDTGPGIPKENHERIFSKFTRLEGTQNTTQHWSTGLGLTFCKLAVQAHGGKIGVISEPGKGSTFWFTLPWLPSVPQGTPAMQAGTSSTVSPS